MVKRQHAHDCIWAVQTLLLSYPHWLAGEDVPWSCSRGKALQPLTTTEACHDCPHFEDFAAWQAAREQNPGPQL